ncbi:hypothetical protein BaRGS_00009232 [Batillaria attramentaria]|uniref:Proteasome assembly chaperone 3 n=1 Tax=Batillaria attramentaria TaxID=370345 RepID=A0ABD0LJ76_9CAEN
MTDTPHLRDLRPTSSFPVWGGGTDVGFEEFRRQEEKQKRQSRESALQDICKQSLVQVLFLNLGFSCFLRGRSCPASSQSSLVVARKFQQQSSRVLVLYVGVGVPDMNEALLESLIMQLYSGRQVTMSHTE